MCQQDFSPPEGGVGLVPKRGCLLTLAYYITHYPDDESLESDGGMILTGENRRTRRKTCPIATFSTTNPIWIDPGANTGLRGERPATNHLSHGTVWQQVTSANSRTISDAPGAVNTDRFLRLRGRTAVGRNADSVWGFRHGKPRGLVISANACHDFSLLSDRMQDGIHKQGTP
jgi:hypothetical protein